MTTTELLMIFVALFIGFIVGIVIDKAQNKNSQSAYEFNQTKEENLRLARENVQLSEQLENMQAEHTKLSADLAASQSAKSVIEEQLVILRKEQTQDRERERLEKENETKILKTLSPIKETLQEVGKKISDIESQRKEQYGTLQEQMRNASQANRLLMQTTNSLSSALRANTSRGAWGEAQLKNILESIGLMQHVDFDTQVTIQGESNTLRPDMIIHLPGGKHVPVDSKVPFNAYLEATSITDTSDPEQAKRKEELLKKHAEELKNHVKKLSSKKYGEIISGAPDFVIAFIPSEAILADALKTDPTLLEFSFNSRVVLASPSTLWAVLKTISFAWQQEAISKDALEVFNLSKELYDRIGTVVKHATKLGTSINSSVDNYNKFVGSLERNVMSTVKKINKLENFGETESAKTIEGKTRSFTQDYEIEGKQ